MLHRPLDRPPARRARAPRPVAVTVLAGLAFVVAGIAGTTGVVALVDTPGRTAATSSPAVAPSDAGPRAGGVATPSALDLARARTRDLPRDAAAWSGLALTALEAGRASADPALYAEAAAAARTSLTVQPRDNDLALAAQAALADAEHDFDGARSLALQALAVNPRSPVALAALTDALTELGRLDDALDAARRLDAVRPGVASFSRLSYQAELRGDLPRARALMTDAAAAATTPAQVAFARAQEGLLALAAGDVTGAGRALDAGRAVAPDDVALAHLAARVAVGRGDTAGAVAAYAAVVARRPSPAYAAEQAEVLTAAGDTAGARAALDLARAGYALQTASGVRPEGAQVLFEADQGEPATAVRLGREVLGRSPTAGNADALAWALHRAGDDRAALPLADRALAPSRGAPAAGRPAGALAHRGAIRAALGDRSGAVADLRAALAGRPRFSPAAADEARRLLDRLEARP